jgi:hypothetical protein
MKKSIGTILGSLIFILIILAVFSSIILINNQMFNLFSNQITMLNFETEKQNEKIEIISSAFDKYFPRKILITTSSSYSGNIFSLLKPFDDNYLSLNSQPVSPSQKLINVSFIFNEIDIPLTITEIRISLIFSYDLNSILFQYVYIFKWSTNSWVLIDSENFNEDIIFSHKIISVTNDNYIHSNSTLKIRIESRSNDNFKAYFDFISLKIENNDLNKTVATYILNNSPFSSKLVSSVIFNNTLYKRYDLNITIPSGNIILIKIKTDIINSNIKFITKLGNIYQSTISN